MFRRVTFLLATLILVSSISFALPSGCSNFFCVSGDDGNQECIRQIKGGNAPMFGCTTINYCDAQGCVSFCSATYCYFV